MGRPKSAVYETMDSVFETLKSEIMRDIRVATVARVTAVNSNFTINAQPVVKEKINTKSGYEYMALPELINIPYLAGQTPIIGDYVVCLHFDRSIAGLDLLRDKNKYLESGEHRHNITDCVALFIAARYTPEPEKEWELICELSPNENVSLDNYEAYLELRVVIYGNNGGHQGCSGIFYREDGDIWLNLQSEGFVFIDHNGEAYSDSVHAKIYAR